MDMGRNYPVFKIRIVSTMATITVRLKVPLRLFGTTILDGCSSYCEGQSLADQAKELLGHTGLNSPRGLQGNVFFWMRNQLLIKIAEPFRRNP